MTRLDRAVVHARVADEVLKKLGGLVDAALHDGDRVGVEVLRNEAREHLGRGRGDLRRLAHDGVPGGDRRDHRLEQELDRVVPGGDHQDHAERLPHHARGGRLLDDRHRDLLRPHPVGHVLQRVPASC